LKKEKLITGSNNRNSDLFVNKHVEPLDYSNIKNKQKTLEICHTGKFLYLLDDYYEIHEVTDNPDFILREKEFFVGLEHQIIVNEKSRERRGFF
jgi:hypothetical protein